MRETLREGRGESTSQCPALLFVIDVAGNEEKNQSGFFIATPRMIIYKYDVCVNDK